MDGGRKRAAPKSLGCLSVCLSPPATDLHLHNLLSPENRRQTTCQTSEAAQRATYHQRTVQYHNYVCGVVQAPGHNAEKGIHSVRGRAKSKKSITTHAKMRDTCFSLEARMYSGAFAASMIGRGIKAPQLAEPSIASSIYRSNYGTRTLSIPDYPTSAYGHLRTHSNVRYLIISLPKPQRGSHITKARPESYPCLIDIIAVTTTTTTLEKCEPQSDR